MVNENLYQSWGQLFSAEVEAMTSKLKSPHKQSDSGCGISSVGTSPDRGSMPFHMTHTNVSPFPKTHYTWQNEPMFVSLLQSQHSVTVFLLHLTEEKVSQVSVPSCHPVSQSPMSSQIILRSPLCVQWSSQATTRASTSTDQLSSLLLSSLNTFRFGNLPSMLEWESCHIYFSIKVCVICPGNPKQETMKPLLKMPEAAVCREELFCRVLLICAQPEPICFVLSAA